MASSTDRAGEGALVAAAQRGDCRARAALYERHVAQVERVLGGVLGVDGELQDCTQEVFVEVFAHLGSLRDPSAFRGWLSVLATHVALKLIRHRQRRAWLVHLPPDALRELHAPAATAAPEVREALRAVASVLSQMKAGDRRVFLRRHVEGLELGEVARSTGVSLSTVNRQLRKSEQQFLAKAQRHETLNGRIHRGARGSARAHRAIHPEADG